MGSGGARIKSGPPRDPDSRTSERRGFTVTALPSEGYSGQVPDLSDFLTAVTSRHLSIWENYWSTPQACAWSIEPWTWQTIADLVDIRVRADDPDAPASLWTSIRQLRDDVALSDQGMKARGWAIAVDEVAARAAQREAEKAPVASSRDRMKVSRGSGA